MKNRNFVWLWMGAIFCGFGLLRVFPAQASDGQEVSGFYEVIAANIPNANEVQVTLRIRLTNLSETSLTITQLELQNLSSMPKTTAATSSASSTTEMLLFLASHDSRTVKRQFTVSRMEYEQWQKGGHPCFLLTMETSASQHISRFVPLFQMKGIRE